MAVSEVVSPIHYTTAQHSMPDLRPELSELLGVEMTDEQVEKLKLLFAQVQALPFPCNVCKQCPLSHFPRRLPTQQPSNPATQFQPPLLIPVGTAWYCMVYRTHFVVHYLSFCPIRWRSAVVGVSRLHLPPGGRHIGMLTSYALAI